MVTQSRKGDGLNMPTKLSKLHVYSIQWLNSNNWTPETIAKELKLTISQVEKILAKHRISSEDTHTPTNPINNLLITHTSGKQINSVAIMTKEASELGDASRIKSNNDNNKHKNSIFRPKQK